MSKRYHMRVIALHFSPEDIPETFASDAEYQEWLKAIGYAVTHGLRCSSDWEEDMTQFVNLTLSKDELFVAQHAPTPSYPEKWEDGSVRTMDSTFSKVFDVINDLIMKAKKRWPAFVMGGIRREGGRYSFHS